jgi:hypothetical protein
MPKHILRVLGPINGLVVDGKLTNLGNSKFIALLYYLIRTKSLHTRIVLGKFIWTTPDDNALNAALSALRGVFGTAAFPPRAKEVSLNPELVACDAEEFRAAALDSSRRQEAIDLYGGPLLGGLTRDKASQKLLDWIQVEGRQLEALYLSAVEAACVEAAAASDWDRVEGLARAGMVKSQSWPAGQDWLDRALAAAVTPTPAPTQSPGLPSEATGDEPPAVQPHQIDSVVSSGRTAGPPIKRRQRLLWIGAAGVVGLTAAVLMLNSGNDPVAATSDQTCGPSEVRVQLVREIYINGARIRPGTAFTKGWVLQNIGQCSWPGDLGLRHSDSSGTRLSMAQGSIRLDAVVPPGAMHTVRMPMRGPGAPGRYSESWILFDPRNPAEPIVTLTAGIVVPQAKYELCQPGQAKARLVMQRYENRTVIAPGSAFTWSWAIRNVGDCSWSPGVHLRYVGGDGNRFTQANESHSTPRPIDPLESYTFLTPARASAQPASYREDWRLEARQGDIIPVDDAAGVSAILQVSAPSSVQSSVPICAPGEAVIGFLNEDILDESVIEPGTPFLKRWTVTNDGPCALDSRFRFKHHSNTGIRLSEIDSLPVRELFLPRTIYTFEVPMKAPSDAGSYREDWGLEEPSGELVVISITPTLWVKITVP